MSRPVTVVDLFAGVGGMTLGFLAARVTGRYFDVRLMSDIDSAAAYTFKKNYPTVPYWVTDLRTATPQQIMDRARVGVGELDFLVGGPPCQGLSSNGKRDISDERNSLLTSFVSMVGGLSPKLVMIENVPTAIGVWRKLYKTDIGELFPGYRTSHAVLNASAFGVPQMRRRVFIVAARQDVSLPSPEFPVGSHDVIDVGSRLHEERGSTEKFVSVEEAIGDLPELRAGQGVDGEPYRRPPETEYQTARRRGSVGLFNHVARSHSDAFVGKIGVIAPGGGNATLAAGDKFSESYYSQAYARLHAKGIGFTITAHFRNPGSGRFTHYRDERSLTVREAARLQSFDDRFVFYGFDRDQERHVGNAVPPLLSRALAEHFGASV